MARLWCGNEETFFGQLIHLSAEGIVVATPDETVRAEMRRRLTNDEIPESAFGKDADVIPYVSVKRISTDKHDRDIEIQYQIGGEMQEKTLRLVSSPKRDEVYAELKAIFSGKFDETEDSYSMPRAAIGSLLSLSLFGGLTWIAANAAIALRTAGDYEIEGRNAGTKATVAWILEFLGPIGVSLVGGTLCFLSATMLYMRVKQPQSLLVLQHEPYRPDSPVILIGKYLLLFFMWYVAARAAL